MLWGEGGLQACEQARSQRLKITRDDIRNFCTPTQTFDLQLPDRQITNLITFVGHDWELQRRTVLMTGLTDQGFSIWGKRVE